MREILKTFFEALALPWCSLFSFFSRVGAPPDSLCARVPVSLIGNVCSVPVVRILDQHASLFGLVLAIGLWLTTAIVVVEAVERHIEEGMSPA